MEDTRPKFLESVAEHPDVQRLIKQVVRSDFRIKELEAEIEDLKAKLAKPVSEHPDVQRLIGQVAELQIKFHELQDENVELQAKNERLSKRDCNATVQILLPTADSPFNKEDCRIVDVGVMDNIYAVECEAVVELQAENKGLKEAIRAALRISCLWTTKEAETISEFEDEAKALQMMKARFEQALKGQTND